MRIKTTFLTFFALLLAISTDGLLRADIVAHFPLDEDSIDTISGFEGDDPEVEYGSNGVFGGAASFEGFGGIAVPYDEALNPEDAFSVTAWVNPAESAGWNTVVSTRSHSTGDEGQYITGYILYNTPGEEWDFWTGGGGAPGSWGRNLGDLSELDEWQHLAITYDGESDTKTLYINGEDGYVVSNQGYEANPEESNPFLIGVGDDVGTNFFFIGQIDDVSVWDETLSQTAIQSIMTDGVAAFVEGGDGVAGDFNNDGVLDAAHINALTEEILTGGAGQIFDVNSDGVVNTADHVFWVESLKNTYLGDANFDLVFDSTDFVSVFAAAEYEDGIAGNSLWQTGDWNADAEFDSSDFVAAFSGGPKGPGYEIGPRAAAAAAVPEPSSLVLLLISLIGFARLRRNSK